MTGYCTYCQNTGTVDCECGGDLCLCGAGEVDCPACGGEFDDEPDDDGPPVSRLTSAPGIHGGRAASEGYEVGWPLETGVRRPSPALTRATDRSSP